MSDEFKKSIKEILQMLKHLYCFKCEYADECSPESPEYLYRCKFLEDWVLKHYRRLGGKESGKET